MSDQYIGEVRLFPYLRGAPSGWFACDGALKAISEYDTLFALIGTTYGGDGVTTFAVPDLRGRVAAHVGPGLPLGSMQGTETVTLATQNLPPHSHQVVASTAAATSTSPSGAVPARLPAGDGIYSSTATGGTSKALGNSGFAGQNLPHENCGPTLTLLPCICYSGVFPQQS